MDLFCARRAPLSPVARHVSTRRIASGVEAALRAYKQDHLAPRVPRILPLYVQVLIRSGISLTDNLRQHNIFLNSVHPFKISL